jgi:8-oxo-dGTP pyrophosphatase MutT (NUDIX family)
LSPAPVERFVVVPAVYVLLLRPAPMPGGREVLLQLRQGTGYMDGHWAAAAAGHVEAGESVYDAAAREAREELGITDPALEPWCAMQRSGRTGDPIDERVDYFLTATSWSGVPRVLEPQKCAELRWCNLADLPDPVVPHERVVLDSVRLGSVPPILVHGFG